jgi:hypothetical protein
MGHSIFCPGYGQVVLARELHQFLMKGHEFLEIVMEIVNGS